jgi:hypothetical protein
MEEKQDDKIPLFGSWARWYVFVLVCHALLILFFKYFTNYFA